jgi:hypothetical protein
MEKHGVFGPFIVFLYLKRFYVILQRFYGKTALNFTGENRLMI